MGGKCRFEGGKRLEFYGKARISAGRASLLDLDRLDPGSGRALLEPGTVGGEGRARSLRPDLDVAVVKVAHPAAKTEALRLAARRVAEPDALHPTGYHGMEGCGILGHVA